MPRSSLDQELKALNELTLRLGSLVDKALEQALDALGTQNLAMCGLVIASDSDIDALRAAIERRAFRLLTLQQPLGGRDVRFLTSLAVIVSDLERAGDGAEGIAQLLVRMLSPQAPSLHSKQRKQRVLEAPQQQELSSSTPRSEKETEVLRELLELGQEARRTLQATMKAFALQDVQAAHHILKEDDVVDVRYHIVRHDLMTMLSGIHAISALAQDEKCIQRITYYLWMAHKLERVADHCTNVCERIIFIAEGKMPSAPTGKS